MSEADDSVPVRGLYRFVLVAVFALGCVWEGAKGIYRELPKVLGKPLSPDPVAALHDLGVVQVLVLSLGATLLNVFAVLVRRDRRAQLRNETGGDAIRGRGQR